jgi:putative DNA-invertase from lambdoid prophage Rac
MALATSAWRESLARSARIQTSKVFAKFERDILRDRVKAGIAQARKDGKPHGRPKTASNLAPEMRRLRKDGLSKRAISKRLGVSRTSVIRLLAKEKRSRA